MAQVSEIIICFNLPAFGNLIYRRESLKIPKKFFNFIYYLDDLKTCCQDYTQKYACCTFADALLYKRLKMGYPQNHTRITYCMNPGCEQQGQNTQNLHAYVLK